MLPLASLRRLIAVILVLSAGLFWAPTPSSNTAVSPSDLQTYRYDFESGTSGWQWQSGIWSWAAVDGGHGLRGEGHGWARLMEHTGEASSFRFRFRLEDLESTLIATLWETYADGTHRRYYVSLGGGTGMTLVRQQGATFTNLGVGYVPISPGVFYEALILVGGGSIDVFLNGEGVVGADDPAPPPPGYVSFESLDNSVAFVDDVEVQFGPEAAPHSRAPRSPLSFPPGPDVGPFIAGIHAGNISLGGTDAITLTQGRYTVREGQIYLSGSSRLRIEQGAALVFDRGNIPLVNWGIHLTDGAALEVDGGQVVPTLRETLVVDAFGNSSVSIQNARPWIHLINTDQRTSVSMANSRLVTTLGGSIQLVGQATVDVRDSQVGSFALVVLGQNGLSAEGLSPGTFSDFDLQRDLAVSGIGYSLRLRNVELVPDTLHSGDFEGGGFERGWVITADETANVRLGNSELRKIYVQLNPAGPDFAASGLRLNQAITSTVGNITTTNVTVTGQWGFTVIGSRKAVFDDSDGLWFFLYDRADVLMRNSSMNEFDPRSYTGTLTFENSSWNGIGEIVNGNDFLMAGAARITGSFPFRDLSWWQSTVTRRFPIVALDARGNPAPGVTITLTRSTEVVTAVTGAAGIATVDLRFTDANYTQPWHLVAGGGRPPTEVNFLTSTPIVLSGTRLYFPLVQRNAP